MSSESGWPKLVKSEYDHFERTGKCLNADKFNEVFGFREESKRLILDYPPCFFAGNILQSKFILFSLNPGYNEKRNRKEREIYRDRGWEETYIDFFEWFSAGNIRSPYYSRFAVFLAGLLRKEIPENREDRYRLLSQYLTNLDIVPYHSRRISLRFKSDREEKLKLVKPYLTNTKELVQMHSRKGLFINGAAFESLLEEMGFRESKVEPVNESLSAHLGECFSVPTVWFDKFLSGLAAHPTNKELSDIGEKIRPHFRI